MTNVPKPDLERGAYIVYTDEPGEVISPGSTGGGGGVVIELTVTGQNMEMQASYEDLYNYFNDGKTCALHVVDEQFSTYGMMPIAHIEHTADVYKAVVIWTMTGDAPLNAEFTANNATDNLVFSMGG